jgi:monoamine oxidase
MIIERCRVRPVCVCVCDFLSVFCCCCCFLLYPWLPCRGQIAGEAVHPVHPMMVHGAWLSGVEGAERILATIATSDEHPPASPPVHRVVVIGAGAAGCGALVTLLAARARGVPVEVTVLEARARLGGRAYSITLGGVAVDVGASWLQQFDDNVLAREAERLHMPCAPTDFHAPLATAADGPVCLERVEAMLDRVCNDAELFCLRREDPEADDIADMSVADGLAAMVAPSVRGAADGLESFDRMRALIEADILIDSGTRLDRLSLAALTEPGIGVNDHFLPRGYTELLTQLVVEQNGLTHIRFETPVSRIEWTGPTATHAIVHDRTGVRWKCDHCVVTVPVSILQDASTLAFDPPLPPAHLAALSRLELGLCNKVILRFAHRWWPSLDNNNLLRWYGARPYGHSFTEMLDLTDSHGQAIIVMFIAGPHAIASVFAGKTDAEVAEAACDALRQFAECVARDRSAV